MAWAVDVDGTKVRLADLKLSVVLDILGDGAPTEQVVMQLLAQPLSDFPRAIKIAEHCASIAGQSDAGAWVNAYLDRSWLDFTKLFVEVEDDLPNEIRDGVPTEGAGGSTAG